MHKFALMDVVELTKDYLADYYDCVPGGKFHLHAGQQGEIISDSYLDFGFANKWAVRFFEEENYPMLVFNCEEIGPGHYIPEDLLCLSVDRRTVFEPASDSDIDQLFA